MKRTICLISIIALIFTLCFPAGAFAASDYTVVRRYLTQQGIQIKSLDYENEAFPEYNTDLYSVFKSTDADGAERYWLFDCFTLTVTEIFLEEANHDLEESPEIIEENVDTQEPPANQQSEEPPANQQSEEPAANQQNKESAGNQQNEELSDKQQMINYTAKGTESFTVTLPIQYSSSKDTNGKVTMSGEFKIDVTDLAGDGQQYVNLKLTDASHKDRYFISDDNTRYDAQDANNSLTEVIDCYLQNEDVATAKIQYAMQKRISDTETSAFNVGDYVICKSVNTMAADYGPFSVTETLEFLLDPNGLTPITDIAHGTYSDLLTFESSVTAADPQA